jgi:hypothetical protein
MTDDRQGHPLYFHVWTTLRQVRFRNRIIATSVGGVLVALCGVGLLFHSGTLAATGAIGAITIFWLVQCGLLDGDLVATCLHLMYNRSLTPVELAILDMHSHSRAQVSQIDRSIQRALRLYRSLNHNRLYR